MSKKKHKNITPKPETKQIQTFPKLGHQLIATNVPPLHDAPTSKGWIRIAPTWKQRLKKTIITFAEGFGFAAIAACFLYLPDFVADYAHRSERFVNFFFSFVIAAVCIIGFFAALMTFIRDTVCYIHPETHRVFCGSRFNKQTISQSADIRDISVLQILPPSGLTKRARIVTVSNQAEITIAETIGDDQDLKELYDWMSRFR